MPRLALNLAALCLISCNDGRAPAASPPAPEAAGAAAGEVVVQAEDDGRSFDVARGATVTFRLAGSSGTGFVWTPTGVDPAVLVQQGERATEVASDAPGAPRVDVYRFTAGSAGKTTVEMSLRRPFGSSPAARAIHVTVNVR